MKKILLQFSYDGSKFSGFQRQKNVRNVQGELEKALSDIYNENIVIKGSGRTDAKVHAIAQCAHFAEPYKVNKLKTKLNLKLKDIKISKVQYVRESFHARYSVKSKRYDYIISFNKNDDENYALIQYKELDIKKMKKASKLFIGTHNFQNFVAGKRDDYVTTIFDIKFKHTRNKLILKFSGIGFYRYMVRNLVGALIEVGLNKVSTEVIKDMLEKPYLSKQLSTAKANGLYLVKIKY